jgi:sporulation protein YlmC with PRC-barrel domain
MKKLITAAVGTLMLSGIAFAQAPQIMSSVPAQSATIADWYKQSVYDPSNSKIGEIMDVLLSPDGKVNALIVGVGRLRESRWKLRPGDGERRGDGSSMAAAMSADLERACARKVWNWITW